jgi:AsmA-like C-terminal region
MTRRTPSWKWLIVLAVFVALAGGTGLYVAWRARHMDNAIRDWVVHALSDHFNSRVELATLHVAPFPELSVTGHELLIYYDGRPDLPPLIRIDKFTFSLHWTALWKLPKHISSAELDKMTITVPPRGERSTEKPEKKSARDKLVSWVVVDHVICMDTTLITLPKKADPGKPQKEPLEWRIHNLDLRAAGLGKPFHFTGTLTNAKPKGEIATDGDFGPWDVDEPGGTPVRGKYTFTDADLGPFPGIAGILSSTGKYDGEIDKLAVEGETDTPNFSLDKVGKPVPLHTEYSATVDGTNGDTFLHPVRATLVHSLITAQGDVVSEPPKKGKKISVSFSAPDARIQDILSLAINSEKPFLTGPAQLKGKLVIPQGDEKVVDRMVLDAQIGIAGAKWSSAAVRGKLESLSRRAEGKPTDEEAGSAVSNLYGRFHLENGVVNFSSVSFSVPGASIDLAGTYKLVSGEIDMKGHLKLQAEISQTVTGAKSFFLKVLDPFFKKNGAGTEIPITITGTRDKPDIGVTIFHKKIEKKLSEPKNSSQR